MPVNNQRPAMQPPASPRNTAKYTNKDGSKFITVPKTAGSESSQPSTPTTSKPADDAPPEPTAYTEVPAPTVNRKKQKRRQKAAAKAAAEQAVNGHQSPVEVPSTTQLPPPIHDDVNSDDDDGYEDAPGLRMTNGHPESGTKSKKNKKKKKKKAGQSAADMEPTLSASPSLDPHATLATAHGSGMSRDKIWSTSNQEERERIKEFWLGLGEDERKSLVKVEKDAVLKKMKEQQKHTCSCTVCGRKRTAIEEELEGLYDAYYLELEQFANQGEGPPLLAPPRDFPTRPFRGMASPYPPQPPSRGRIVEHVGDEDEDEIEEVYSEDEVEEDDYSDEEPPEEYHGNSERDVADFLTFGNSLQVKGGILTVADDLLKNDGKHFIEMMEQLAERRMAREEDAREHFSRGYGHPNGSYSVPHNHPPPDEEDDYEDDDEEEDDYEDSQDDDEYEEEEDPMTEEQRMEEGRRMFQIFAARMFEQRVLSAYKEKVAKERQAKLLEELEEEDRKEDEQKARKAKNAQRKKEKAAEKKKALAEEKARKEAEKAAEEAERLRLEEEKAAEQRQKAEEKRRQKEAQRKAEEEARLKREAERQRRAHEQREKQFEQERKAREAKEREKKLKDEQRLKEKLAREQKEREALERREKQERDKREKEARAAKAQKEAQAAREARERRTREEQTTHKPTPPPQAPQHPASHAAPQPSQQQSSSSLPVSKRGPQVPGAPTALPQHPPNPVNFASPKVPVATPVISKAPTPIRQRTLSQQQQQQQQDASLSASSTPQPTSIPSHDASPRPEASHLASPLGMGQPRKESGSLPGAPFPHSTQASSPSSGISSHPSQSTPASLPPIGMQPPPGLTHQGAPPGFPSRIPQDPMMPPGFRPGPMMPPPGINGPVGRGFSPAPMPPPSFAQGHGDQFPIGQGFPVAKDAPVAPHGHSRQGSGGYDAAPLTPAQPIGRPAPIGRPISTNHGHSQVAKDEEAQHLGSRALLGDDEPLGLDTNIGSFRTQPPGPRGGFGAGPFVDTPFSLRQNPWGPPSAAAPPGFGAPALPSNATWGPPGIHPAFSVGSPGSAFGAVRPNQSSILAIRSLLCQGCRDLVSLGHGDADGFVDVATLEDRIQSQHGKIEHHDVTDLFDTEGNASNGGGVFETKTLRGREYVRWSSSASDGMQAQPPGLGAPGQIGSPPVGSAAALRGM